MGDRPVVLLSSHCWMEFTGNEGHRDDGRRHPGGQGQGRGRREGSQAQRCAQALLFQPAPL